jgi:pSer/pThr/pTyr-binding forkhead associated (FHA) protein
VVTDPVEARSAEAEIGQVVVQGVVCPRGHFNDPRARFCSSCGISMAHQTRTLVPGPRPPLGVLVFEDGTTYSLSSNYVVGRQPESHPVVQSRQALPLVLEDGRRTISRAHAEIRLDGWDVHFINLSATNGSYLWDQQYQQWMALAPGQPVVLAPGMRIAMGQRTAVFESALVR